MAGKGQFICGNKKCEDRSALKSWEVNFAYLEHDEKKNALIKLRLCPDCSNKLNYHSKKREVKRMKKKAKHSKHDNEDSAPSSSTSSMTHTENSSSTEQQINTPDEPTVPLVTGNGVARQQLEQIFWAKSTNEEEKTREEEFDEYLADLLL